MMIFDLPPMMACDDMMAFAPHVDCVLLLAAAEGTKMDDLDRCERELAGATNVLGIVLNKCRYMEPGYGYGYY
jgi:Mrp family chromosome partitioning ATPase